MSVIRRTCSGHLSGVTRPRRGARWTTCTAWKWKRAAPSKGGAPQCHKENTKIRMSGLRRPNDVLHDVSIRGHHQWMRVAKTYSIDCCAEYACS